VPGGTLTPSSLFANQPPITPLAMSSHLLTRRALPSQLPGGRLNFIKFETENILDCVAFLQELISSSAKANNVSLAQMRKGVKLMATGGGAHKFHKMFEKELGVEVRREDEMGCLITGLNFITLIPDEAFYYSDELVDTLNSNATIPVRSSPSLVEKGSVQDQLPRPSPDPPLYAPVFDSNPLPKLPCLLVNIGSGVSIIKVDDHGKFERVSGTSLGGGTLWGLLSLLTDADSFDEMLELASQGDNGTVDMLVSDIYGSSDALNSLGLKSNTIASSFGKVFRKEDARGGESRQGARERRKKKFRQEDICKSLLYAVSNNIGQIAYMNAEKFGLDRIYFGGCFIRGHQATIATLSYAIRFWSKGTKRAFFLRHEGYLGAVGCWIKQLSDPVQTTKKSKARHAASTEVNADLPESKVSTPKSSGYMPTNGMNGNNINPILAEALGGMSMGNAQSMPTKAPLSNGNIHSNDDLKKVIVASDDVKALASQDEEKEIRSLLTSLSKEDMTLLGPLVQSGSADEALSVADLLKQLDDASGAADGLESKLDSLLSRLDSLLEEDQQ
jgi:type II pantothenate kinase